MDLRAYLVTLRRSWLLLVVPAIVGLVVALVVLAVQTPRYLSTANVYVSVGNASNANDLSQANSFAQSAAANFAALAEQPYVLHAVRQKLRLSLTSDQIAKEMTTTVQPETSIISIEVLDASPLQAARIANATATQLGAAVSDLSPGAANGSQNVKVTVVRTATAAPSATVPNRPLGLALGVLGGLLLGLVLIILRELLDTRVRDVADLQKLIGAPVVGQIPDNSSLEARPLVLLDAPASAAAEGYRVLQLNTEYLRAPGGVVTVGIASAVPSEGKSTVAANLALALAAAGHRVALVDADLRRPRLHTMFGIDNALGLTEVLIGRADVLDAVQAWGSGGGGIAILPAGSTPPNPGELLQSPRLRAALDRIAEEADVVIVDGPPLLAVADSAVLARTVDAVLLVASLRRSHRGPVGRAVFNLQNVGAAVLGVVATMTRPTRADAEAYTRYATPSVSYAVPTPIDEVDAGPVLGRVKRLRRRSRPAALAPAAAAEVEVQAEEAGSRSDPAIARNAGDPQGAVEQSDAAEMQQDSIEESFESPTDDAEPLTGGRKASERGGKTERDVRAAGRPTRVPAAQESDPRTLRSAKRKLSEQELRVLRSFSSQKVSPFLRG